jgi:hypothetical protein
MTEEKIDGVDWGVVRSAVHGEMPRSVFGYWDMLTIEQQSYALNVLGQEHLARHELARENFRLFVAMNCADLKMLWYNEVIMHEVQQWADADDDYALIFDMPIGFGKTLFAQMVCMWLSIKDWSHVLFASYNFEVTRRLVDKMNRAMSGESLVCHCEQTTPILTSIGLRHCRPNTVLVFDDDPTPHPVPERRSVWLESNGEREQQWLDESNARRFVFNQRRLDEPDHHCDPRAIGEVLNPAIDPTSEVVSIHYSVLECAHVICFSDGSREYVGDHELGSGRSTYLTSLVHEHLRGEV